MPSHIKNHQSLKDTFKEKPNLFSGEHQMFFGDKFQNYVFKTFKTRQRSEELFNSMNKGKLQLFRQALYRKKKASKGSVNFMRRPSLNSRVASTNIPTRSSSCESLSKKGAFLQHVSRIDSAKSGKDKFCSTRANFTRHTAKSDFGRQIRTFSIEETN